MAKEEYKCRNMKSKMLKGKLPKFKSLGKMSKKKKD